MREIMKGEEEDGRETEWVEMGVNGKEVRDCERRILWEICQFRGEVRFYSLFTFFRYSRNFS